MWSVFDARATEWNQYDGVGRQHLFGLLPVQVLQTIASRDGLRSGRGLVKPTEREAQNDRDDDRAHTAPCKLRLDTRSSLF